MEEIDLNDLTDEEYFGELKVMFQTRGWRIFTAELFDNAEFINDLQDVKCTNDLHYRKGKLDSIGTILNFEDTIKRAEEDGLDEGTE